MRRPDPPQGKSTPWELEEPWGALSYVKYQTGRSCSTLPGRGGYVA